MFLLVAVVLLVVLPPPWGFVAFGTVLVLFLGGLGFLNRTLRGRRVEVGVETLIGKTAAVVTSCRPDGQVRLQGETWRARCAEGVDRGETVVVVSREKLTLVVEQS